MPSVTISAAQPIVRLELIPPPGATALIVNFTVTPPAAPTGNVRICHLRTLNSAMHPNLPAEGRLPRESEICELKVRNGTLTAEFSGYGGNRAKNPVKHMGGMPQGTFPVTLTVPFTGHQAVVAAGAQAATSDTDVAPNGQHLEFFLGMKPVIGADLGPPTGYTFSWEDDAVEWPGAPAGVPPVPQLPPVVDPQVGPFPGPVESSSRSAAISLLKLLLPTLPPEEVAIFQPILATLTSGGKLDSKTLLLTLLPLLLGGGK
jgi:hypothetical protein